MSQITNNGRNACKTKDKQNILKTEGELCFTFGMCYSMCEITDGHVFDIFFNTWFCGKCFLIYIAQKPARLLSCCMWELQTAI